ncbi:MAG: tRNA dihydrouridine synthase DusB [Spirochaetales bacterium]|nr:tRNA dihydrouridine synthase DusB [Spirochaetales bacterium]
MESQVNSQLNFQSPDRGPLIHPLSIGECVIPGNIFLAPMAGFTDAAFRAICLKKGAFFTYTEMVSAEACMRKSEKTLKLLERAESEKILGMQVFGSQPKQIAAAVREIIKYGPALIDLNCGCSIPKILKTGSGAHLLKNPKLIGEIIRAMNQETDVPVTLKIRSGWDTNTINYSEIGLIAQEAGASLITLHPRTRSERFSGHSDWDHITQLKDLLSIPVIGSGDLFTPEDVCAMLTRTGCDGVMIARGAIGNPFIFSEVRNACAGEISRVTITPEERLLCALEHLKKFIALKGEAKACTEMRKHFCAYTKGLSNSSVLRRQCVHASTESDYEKIVDEFIGKKND